MAKYRIRVECLDGSNELDAEYRAGIECEGFTLIEKHKDGFGVGIEDMSRDSISDAIAQNDTLAQSAILAEAKRRVYEMRGRERLSQAIINGLDI